MKRIGLVFVLLLVMLGLGVSVALAYRTYLPIVNKQATPTITPSPTSIPLDVQILPNDSYYIDSYGSLNVLGEVLNNSNADLSFVKITVNFYNASGQPLDSYYAYTYLDDLPAWESTCFQVSVPVPSGWAYYQFEAPTYYTDGRPFPNLTVLNDSGSYNSTYGWYDITGDVRNNESVTIYSVSPVGTLYDNLGNVVGCDFILVDSTDLTPGAISPFDITFFGRDYSDVTSYKLQVDGTKP
jgi:hypothetical protein